MPVSPGCHDVSLLWSAARAWDQLRAASPLPIHSVAPTPAILPLPHNQTENAVTTYWYYRTKRGTFFIKPRRDGRWTILHEDDALESYSTPQACAEAIATGTGTWPSFGDPSRLGIPETIGGWSAA